MDKFEYTTHTISLGGTIFSKRSLDGYALQKELNKFGDDGWELISKIDTQTNGWTNNVVLVFKRKKT